TLASGDVPATADRVIPHLRQAFAWGAQNEPVAAHRLARLAAFLSYGRRQFGDATAWFVDAAGVAPDPLARARDRFDAGHTEFALQRGNPGYEHYLAAADDAIEGGDPTFAAVALATAVNRVERMAAEFADRPSRDRSFQMLA